MKSHVGTNDDPPKVKTSRELLAMKRFEERIVICFSCVFASIGTNDHPQLYGSDLDAGSVIRRDGRFLFLFGLMATTQRRLHCIVSCRKASTRQECKSTIHPGDRTPLSCCPRVRPSLSPIVSRRPSSTRSIIAQHAQVPSYPIFGVIALVQTAPHASCRLGAGSRFEGRIAEVSQF
jgi:hypothetical protein